MIATKTLKMAAFIVLVILGLMTFSSNPVVDFACTDSAVFKYIGSAMHRGIVPYRDVFDHKGLLIYVINWLGSFAGPSMIGVWIIEIVFCVLSFIIIWKFVSRWFGNESAYVSIFPYAAFFAYGNNAGNFTETYAHLFIVAVLLWVFSCAKKGTCFGTIESFLAGGCFAAILFLRPNMGTFGIVTAIYFIEQVYRDHDFKCFVLNSIFVVLGLISFSLPLIGYLYLNDALLSCWNCYINYNLGYATGTACHSSFMWIAYMLVVIGILPCLDKTWRRPGAYNLIFLSLTTLVLAMNSQYKHYLLMIVPGAILPFAWVVAKFHESPIRKMFSSVIVILSCIFVAKEAAQSNLDISGYINHVKETHRVQDVCDYKEGACYTTLASLMDFIDDKSSVLVIGNECDLYNKYNMKPSGYYAYIPDSYDGAVDARIIKEIVSGINVYAITNTKYFKDKYKDVLEYKYEQVAKVESYILWRVKDYD